MSYDLSYLIADLDTLIGAESAEDAQAVTTNEAAVYSGQVTILSHHMIPDPSARYRAELRQLRDVLSTSWSSEQEKHLNQHALPLLRLIVSARSQLNHRKIAAMTEIMLEYQAHPKNPEMVTTLIERQWQSIFLATSETSASYEHLSDKSPNDLGSYPIDFDTDEESFYLTALKDLRSALARYDVHHIDAIFIPKPDIQSQANLALFADYIQAIIQKAEQIREQRPKGWLDFFQTATFKRDRNAWLGWTASFSVSGWLTDIPDKKLADGFNLITEMLNDEKINPDHLVKIQQFADSLPSSSYKNSIDGMYRALWVVTFMALVMLAPVTVPALSCLLIVSLGSFAIGSAVMGLACHFSLKTYLQHVAEERYEALYSDILNSIMGLQQSEQWQDLEVAEYLKQLLYEIKQIKLGGKTTTYELVKAMTIIQRGLQGDEQALDDLNDLKKSMQFSYLNDSLLLMARAFTLAHHKYRFFSLVIAALTAVQILGSGISSAFAYQTIASFVYGTIPVVVYESVDSINALPHQMWSATIAVFQFLSHPKSWGPTAWTVACHVNDALCTWSTQLFARVPPTPPVEKEASSSLAQKFMLAKDNLHAHRQTLVSKQEDKLVQDDEETSPLNPFPGNERR